MKLVARCRRAVLVLGLVLGVGSAGGACSSSSSSPRDAGCKKSPSGDCAWTPCQGSVADICALFAAHGGACVMGWPADPTSFCPVYTPAKGIDSLATADCGSYRAVQANGVDGGNNYYYDKTTGKLVAVVSHDYNTMTAECRGGPSNFVEPSCGSSQQLSCPDAGGAGSGGAGGVGGSSGVDAGP